VGSQQVNPKEKSAFWKNQRLSTEQNEENLFHTTNKIMAGVTDDFALFRHHGVAALGAGIKELLGFIGIALAFGDTPEV
jgi:hypothetical protein